MAGCGLAVYFLSGCASTPRDPYFSDTRSRANVYVAPVSCSIYRVAIMPFKAPTELIGTSVSDMFVTEFLRARRYTLVERSQMGQVLGEAELASSGLSDARAMELGSMLGADGVILGTVDEYGTTAQRGRTYPVVGIAVRLIDCESGKVMWSADMAARSDQSGQALSGHARKIVHEIASGLYQKWHVQKRTAPRARASAAAKSASEPVAYSKPAPKKEDLPPDMPGDFSVSDFGLREVTLKWKAPKRAYKYIIERAEQREGPFQAIFKGELDSTRYTDDGDGRKQPLKDAATYYYRVAAVSYSGKKGPYTAVKESMTAPPPSPVTGLTAESGFVRCVPLSWHAAKEETVSGYRIERAMKPDGPFEKIEFVRGRDKISEIDGGREPGKLNDHTVYWYRIVAVNKVDAESPPSKPVQAVTRDVPPAVTGLQLESGRPREIALSWDVSPDEKVAGYIVERADADGSAFEEIETIKDRETAEYLDRGGVNNADDLGKLTDGTAYRYRVRAFNIAKAESPNAPHERAVTKPAPVKPSTPKAASGELRKVTLTWPANPEPDIKEYAVEYRQADKDGEDESDGDAFREFDRRPDTVAVKDELKDGRAYEFRIKAIDEDRLESAWSDPVMATTKPPPDAPANLRADMVASGAKKVRWDPPPQSDIKHYRVFEKKFLFKKELMTVNEPACELTAEQIGKKIKIMVSAVDETALESETSETLEVEP